MDPTDLLKLLDLKASPARSLDPSRSISSPDSRSREASASQCLTALEIDEWGLRRGRDLVAESSRLQKAGTDALAAADFFAASFDPDPRLTAGCVDRLRHEFVTQLLETPDYRGLHAVTQLDDTAAAIAAGHFAEAFAQLKKEDAASPAAAEDATSTSPSTPGAAAGVSGGTGADESLAREMAALRAVGQALTEARQEVAELTETAAALGLGPGQPGQNDPRAIAAIYQRVRNDPTLRAICTLAGRFRWVAQSKQRQKTTHGADEVVGIELDGDLGRVLPSELVKLAIPELELDTLRRLIERQLPCRELHATEPVGKGPIIVVVDESGSMEGDPVHTAKALTLALAWIARQQRRWCGLIAYSGNTGERLLTLPPARWNEAKLCDWLSDFLGGGSDLDVPVTELPRMYREIGAPTGTTDIILITDCQCRLPAATRDSFNAWKTQVKARVLTLVIGRKAGDLAAVSDEVHTVTALDPATEAIGRILAL